MDIPVVYQYYPIVPLSDLSDLYSAGENTLNNKKICIISYLPKTLRIDGKFPFNNVYVLFVQNTATVTSVQWSIQLYKNGLRVTDNSFFGTRGGTSNQFVVGFPADLFDSNGQLKVDRMRVTCRVEKNAEIKTLTVEHNFAKMLNVQNAGLFSPAQSMLFAGTPAVSNFLFNHLKDYFHNGSISWFDDVVDVDAVGENTLMRIAASLAYHTISTAQRPVFLPEGYYDLTEFSNSHIETFLTDPNATTYEGEFTSGICSLPLHVLNEVLAGTAIPDFDNINLNNKIYSMIVYDPQVLVNNVQDEFLQVVPIKLADLKERLVIDKQRFTELYVLTMFPKSAITLAAVVVKYIYACSVENDCRDCKNRS
ncbi:MAG TPA: hypothetical protein VHL77_06755, partial [Ferruginibacter sp.]|nr:hypothetical protein [Ferruginibacter sp.]